MLLSLFTKEVPVHKTCASGFSIQAKKEKRPQPFPFNLLSLLHSYFCRLPGIACLIFGINIKDFSCFLFGYLY